jgi:hypothetical protein
LEAGEDSYTCRSKNPSDIFRSDSLKGFRSSKARDAETELLLLEKTADNPTIADGMDDIAGP